MKRSVAIQAIEARRAYDAYFRLCIEHPELATYDNASRLSDFPALDKLWNCTAIEPSKYLWFVAYALKVFDDLLIFDDGIYWKNAIRFQLNFHMPTLKAVWLPHWSKVYSEELGELVANCIEGRI